MRSWIFSGLLGLAVVGTSLALAPSAEAHGGRRGGLGRGFSESYYYRSGPAYYGGGHDHCVPRPPCHDTGYGYYGGFGRGGFGGGYGGYYQEQYYRGGVGVPRGGYYGGPGYCR